MKTTWVKLLVVGLGLGLLAVRPAAAQTWTQASVANTNYFSLVSSADGSILYAAVGTTNAQQIYKSTNSGGTWYPTTLPLTNSIFSLAVSADGSKVFAARNLPPNVPLGTNSDPYFLSTNSGTTWTSVMPGLMTNFTRSIAMSANGNTLIASASRSYSTTNFLIYISTNASATWSTNPVSPITSLSSMPAGVLASASGGKLSVLLDTNLYVTTNAGFSWMTNALPNGPNRTHNYWNTLAGNADGTVLAAICGDYDCVSTNAGNSWVSGAVKSFPLYGYNSQMAITADGSKLIANGVAGAIYISTNLGASWYQTTAPSTNWVSLATSADGNKLVAAANGDTYAIRAKGGIWLSQTTPSPQLNLTPVSTNFTLRWTWPSTNFGLQQSSDLLAWAGVTNAPVLNLTNLQNQVTLPRSGPRVFYRLKTP